MAVIWEFRERVLILALVGDSVEEPSEEIDAALSDPRFKPGTRLLLNIRQPSPKDFRQCGRWMALQRSKGLSSRIAIVVDQQYQDMATIATVYLANEGVDLTIFSDLDQAVRWLAVGSGSGEFSAGTF